MLTACVWAFDTQGTWSRMCLDLNYAHKHNRSFTQLTWPPNSVCVCTCTHTYTPHVSQPVGGRRRPAGCTEHALRLVLTLFNNRRQPFHLLRLFLFTTSSFSWPNSAHCVFWRNNCQNVLKIKRITCLSKRITTKIMHGPRKIPNTLCQ